MWDSIDPSFRRSHYLDCKENMDVKTREKGRPEEGGLTVNIW